MFTPCRQMNPIKVSSFLIICLLYLHRVTGRASDADEHRVMPTSRTVTNVEIENDNLIPVSESEYLHHTDYEGSGISEDTKESDIILGQKAISGLIQSPNKTKLHYTKPVYSIDTKTLPELEHSIVNKTSPGRTGRLEENDIDRKQSVVVLLQTPPAVIVILVLFTILLICTSIIIGFLVVKLRRMRKNPAVPEKVNGEINDDDDEYSVMMDWGTD